MKLRYCLSLQYFTIMKRNLQEKTHTPYFSIFYNLFFFYDDTKT